MHHKSSQAFMFDIHPSLSTHTPHKRLALPSQALLWHAQHLGAVETRGVFSCYTLIHLVTTSLLARSKVGKNPPVLKGMDQGWGPYLHVWSPPRLLDMCVSYEHEKFRNHGTVPTSQLMQLDKSKAPLPSHVKNSIWPPWHMSSLCWRLNLAVQILTTQRMRSPIKSKLQTLQVQVAFPSFNGGDSTTMADADCFTADGEGTLRCGVPRREWRRWATKAKKRPFGRGLLRGSWPVEHVETERNFPQGRSRINVDTPTNLRIRIIRYI